jgi:hypothetical protein
VYTLVKVERRIILKIYMKRTFPGRGKERIREAIYGDGVSLPHAHQHQSSQPYGLAGQLACPPPIQ